MDADGSNLTSLATNPHKTARPSWSPDGAQIAYYAPGPSGYEIFVVNADGSNAISHGRPVSGVVRVRGSACRPPTWGPGARHSSGGVSTMYGTLSFETSRNQATSSSLASAGSTPRRPASLRETRSVRPS